jgi:hypothetical protein
MSAQSGTPRRIGPAGTAAAVVGLGLVVSVLGDACHVASGTTHYEWDGVPTIWRSAIWFPFLVAAALLGAALAGERAGPPARRRGRADIPVGAGAVLALYALTAALRGQPTTVSVTLCAAIAVVVWAWWDPSPGALAIAAGAAVAGPLAEIGIVELGAASYTPGSDGLGGVAPWLPCLYFAAGAVASRLWAAIARDGAQVA